MKVYRNSKGQFHREDGPAIEYSDGYIAWYLNGQLHRTDGPAVQYPNGFKAWYLNGQELTEEHINNKLYRVLYIKE